jgi:hypothetical protein
MSESEYKYKIIDITQNLTQGDSGTGVLSVESKSGWDVQQVFSRWVGNDSERVFALLRQRRV